MLAEMAEVSLEWVSGTSKSQQTRWMQEEEEEEGYCKRGFSVSGRGGRGDAWASLRCLSEWGAMRDDDDWPPIFPFISS